LFFYSLVLANKQPMFYIKNSYFHSYFTRLKINKTTKYTGFPEPGSVLPLSYARMFSTSALKHNGLNSTSYAIKLDPW
jgi:hypothetical protein